MEQKDNGMLSFFLTFSKIIYTIVVLFNLFVPLFDAKLGVNVNVFQIAVIVIWTYGMLCSLGYFKKVVSKSNGVCKYEISIPIVPLGIVRILEGMFYAFLSEVVINWKMFIACIAVDVIYLLLILMDKSNYYYMSVEEEDND